MSLEAQGTEIPRYTWNNGYHINGGNVIESILEQRVFPALEKLPRRFPTVVADFGCGDGRIRNQAPYFSARPYIFRGFDINAAAVARYNVGWGREHISDHAEVTDLTKLNVNVELRRFDAGLLWRVLHAIPNNLHGQVLEQIASTLEPRAVLYVAARSDRDWVAEALQEEGLFKDGEMNDCYPAMKDALDPEGIKTWPLYFFRRGELASVGEEVGLRVVYEEPMKEASGYAVLRENHRLLDYDYVEFRKP